MIQSKAGAMMAETKTHAAMEITTILPQFPAISNLHRDILEGVQSHQYFFG
jgi:hypothetical protein